MQPINEEDAGLVPSTLSVLVCIAEKGLGISPASKEDQDVLVLPGKGEGWYFKRMEMLKSRK